MSTTMRRGVVMMCAVSLVAGGAWAAPRALVDRSLARTPVDLLGWNETTISYLDEFGRVRREPIAQYIAVLPANSASRNNWARPADEGLAGGVPVVIELVDGQRLLGSVGPWDSSSVSVPTAEEDTFAVLTPGFGTRMLPLDRVGRVLIDPWSGHGVGRGPWSPGVDDELILINGDRLRGFLVEFGDEILFDSGEGERTFHLRRIAEVRLGNPPESWTGPRVWWSTGDVRAARASGKHDEGAAILADRNSSGPIVFSVGAIDAAWLDEGGLIPLEGLEIVRHQPLGDRRWADGVRTGSGYDAPLGVPDVVLPGPMRVEWRLPPEAAHFGTIARLGGSLDRPDGEPGRWSDAELRLSVIARSGQTELVSIELGFAAPSAPIAVELPAPGESGRTLVIELGPGRYGPIQDRVLLDRPMLTGF
ncbi:MAG: hypothetical protein K8E66_08565 [Phycisphaerales bacterium]|nr:hypothetical protein [Phycisphaerales bacterium]